MEALHIQQAEGVFHSPVFGGEFDFTELRPRGHYTSSPEMEAYFKAVHYLTELAGKIGAKNLNSLPADVNAKAMQWIAAYQRPGATRTWIRDSAVSVETRTTEIEYSQDFLARFAEKYWLSPAATSFSPRSRLTSNAVTTAEICLPCTGSDWE